MRDDRIDEVGPGVPADERPGVPGEPRDLPPAGPESDPAPAMGGLSGAAAGALAGSLVGPLGTAIGALAGALGGWWAGSAIAHARATDHHDSLFRQRHQQLDGDHLEYDRARPAYQLGWLASRHPEYRERPFEDVEEHVRLGWTQEIVREHGDWNAARIYIREGYLLGPATSDIAAAPYEREVGVPGAGVADIDDEPIDPATLSDRDAQSNAPLGADPGADVAEDPEQGEAVYPSEIDALANGVEAEPGSEADREFRASERSDDALGRERPER